jgi:hypothetical protein
MKIATIIMIMMMMMMIMMIMIIIIMITTTITATIIIITIRQMISNHFRILDCKIFRLYFISRYVGASVKALRAHL